MIEEGDAVGRAARHHIPSLGDLVRVERLDGGYSWRTYRVDGRDQSVIVRVAPAGGTVEPYDPETERRALRAAAGAVPAPTVLAVESDPTALGSAYAIHTLVPGRVLRTDMVVDPAERRRYRAEFVSQLADLHRDGHPAALGDDVDTVGEAVALELERLEARFVRAEAPDDAATVVRWLRANQPRSSEPPVLCHGDYRFGNIAWTAPGEVGGILDWERAWVGDPMADVAFTRLWSGWCRIDDEDLASYAARAGRPADPERLGYFRRFELGRSYASSLLGRKAFVDGRSDDPRLLDIGAAGVSGLARLAGELASTDNPNEIERNHAPH